MNPPPREEAGVGDAPTAPHPRIPSTTGRHAHDTVDFEKPERVESEQNEDGYQLMTAMDRDALTRVATEVSLHQTMQNVSSEPNLPDGNTDNMSEASVSGLDPTKSDFDVYLWAKKVLRAAKDANVKFRRASFTFKNLNVSGSGIAVNLQATVASVLLAPIRLREWILMAKKPPRKILSGFDGVVKPGEMLLVLGRPGSGCSTLLKCIAGELHGLKIAKDSVIHYSGIPQHEMIKTFKGEILYNAEVDRHFPHLTVNQTLEFAAAMRTPENRILATSRKQNVERVTAVAMAVCGLTHTKNTRVGNEYVRGVSGGERKVSFSNLFVLLKLIYSPSPSVSVSRR